MIEDVKKVMLMNVLGRTCSIYMHMPMPMLSLERFCLGSINLHKIRRVFQV